MDPEDKARDQRVSEFMGNWDAARDDRGVLLDSWSPTSNLELALEFRTFVEKTTGEVFDAPAHDPRALVVEGLNMLGRKTGWSRT